MLPPYDPQILFEFVRIECCRAVLGVVGADNCWALFFRFNTYQPTPPKEGKTYRIFANIVRVLRIEYCRAVLGVVGADNCRGLLFFSLLRTNILTPPYDPQILFEFCVLNVCVVGRYWALSVLVIAELCSFHSTHISQDYFTNPKDLIRKYCSSFAYLMLSGGAGRWSFHWPHIRKDLSYGRKGKAYSSKEGKGLLYDALTWIYNYIFMLAFPFWWALSVLIISEFCVLNVVGWCWAVSVLIIAGRCFFPFN